MIFFCASVHVIVLWQFTGPEYNSCTWWLYSKTCRLPTSPFHIFEGVKVEVSEKRWHNSEGPCAWSMFLFDKSTLTSWTLTSSWKIFQVTMKKPLKLLAETNPERYLTPFDTGGPKWMPMDLESSQSWSRLFSDLVAVYCTEGKDEKS